MILQNFPKEILWEVEDNIWEREVSIWWKIKADKVHYNEEMKDYGTVKWSKKEDPNPAE